MALLARACIAASSILLLSSSHVRAVVFTDVTASAGIAHTQIIPEVLPDLPGEAFFSGGAAAG